MVKMNLKEITIAIDANQEERINALLILSEELKKQFERNPNKNTEKQTLLIIKILQLEEDALELRAQEVKEENRRLNELSAQLEIIQTINKKRIDFQKGTF